MQYCDHRGEEEQAHAGRKTFFLEEVTIDDLHAVIKAGRTTCVAVMQHYIRSGAGL